nr:putative ribonuclease H-like domain-containing protein [Tanacetum cinerariifolium]
MLSNSLKRPRQLLESQRLDKNKEGLGYSDVPPPPAQIYFSPKKDLSWTGLLEFKDDTVTDYSRPSPTIESSSDDAQNRNPPVTKEASPSTISPKSFIKFVKANNSLTNKCIVLGQNFKLSDDDNVLLRTPRQHNMYSIDLNNIVPHKDLTCLVAKASTDEYETSGILRKFITEIENLKDLKVKIIRCDNGGEFRNKEMNDFCLQKGIKRKFSNAKTPQQNGVAERRNRTLIEAARTILADAKLLVTFWAEAVNSACYVQNRVLVNKSQNKTPYELFNGRT